MYKLRHFDPIRYYLQENQEVKSVFQEFDRANRARQKKEQGSSIKKLALSRQKYRGVSGVSSQMTEALKGNTKHKVLNPKQIQSTNDQMTKTFRI
jgi:hypothetical protein